MLALRDLSKNNFSNSRSRLVALARRRFTSVVMQRTVPAASQWHTTWRSHFWTGPNKDSQTEDLSVAFQGCGDKLLWLGTPVRAISDRLSFRFV
jgi:hypothetical protein